MAHYPHETILTLFEHPFSARDLIMLVGGLFLLFKATMELNEWLEGKLITPILKERYRISGLLLHKLLF